MQTFFFQTELKSFERVADGVKIKGFASTPDLDRQYDIVIPTAFKRSLDQYIKDGISPALLRSHDSNRPCGKILMDGEDAPVITDAGLLITALVTEKETCDQVMSGEMQTFSIGYIPSVGGVGYEMRGTGKFSKMDGEELYVETRIISDLDWIETSIVSTPANPKAIFSLTKSVKSFFDSFPSSLMKKPCEFCSDKKSSCGMIGKKSICSDCIAKMEFKGEAIKKVQAGATMHAAVFSKEKFDKDAATKLCAEKGLKSDLCVETDKAFVFGQSEEKVTAEQLEASTSETEGLTFLLVKEVETEEQKKVREEKEAADKLAAEELAKKEAEEKAKKEAEELAKKEAEQLAAKSSEHVETDAEKAAAKVAAEEAAAKDVKEETVSVSPEQKETIDYLASVFAEVSKKTATKTEEKKIEKPEEKKIETESKAQAIDLILPILSAFADEIVKLKKAASEMQGIVSKLPAPRGKGMIAFQHSVVAHEQKKEKPTNSSLLNAFKEAKSGKAVTLGSD